MESGPTAPSGIDEAARRERDWHNERWRDDRRREPALKYYCVRGEVLGHYRRLLSSSSRVRVLEVGCGPVLDTPAWVPAGSLVCGVDISEVAVQSVSRGAGEAVVLAQMNVERLAFAPASFDLVCGIGIVHHVDLSRMLSEVSRILKPGGRAVFLEPLGHNPLINLFRRRTPEMRTVDEHPLLRRDLPVLARHFGRVGAHPFILSTLLAVPLRDSPWFECALRCLRALDRLLFTVVPFLRWWSWLVLLVLEKPRVQGSETE